MRPASNKLKRDLYELPNEFRQLKEEMIEMKIEYNKKKERYEEIEKILKKQNRRD